VTRGREREWPVAAGWRRGAEEVREGWMGIRDLGFGRGEYGQLMGQIVLGTKLVVSDRVKPISRVGSGSTLWVEVQAQALPYASCRVDTNPIGRGLG